MKQGRTLVELAQELQRQNDAKRDFVAPGDKIHVDVMHDKSVMMTLADNNFVVNQHAHSQISNRLDIPKKFYDRIRIEQPGLYKTTVNVLAHASNKKHMVRTLDGKVRAFLSSKYNTLDNYDVAEMVLPALTEAGARIESCEVTESHLYLKAVTPKVQGDVKKGDPVQAGIVIRNSEVGASSLSVEPMIYRLVCTNGMISSDSLKKKHVGRASESYDSSYRFIKSDTKAAEQRAVMLLLRDMIDHFFSGGGFEKELQRLRDSLNDKIEVTASEAVKEVTEIFSLRAKEQEGVLEELIRSGDMSRYGLCQAVTRHSQDVESYDRATELERIGGRIIELPRSQWESIAVQ